MSLRHLCLPQGVIIDVLRASASRPTTMNISHARSARCCHHTHQAPNNRTLWPFFRNYLSSSSPSHPTFGTQHGLRSRWHHRRFFVAEAIPVSSNLAKDLEPPNDKLDFQKAVDNMQDKIERKRTRCNREKIAREKKKHSVRRPGPDGSPMYTTGWMFKKPKPRPQTVQGYNKCIVYAVLDNRMNRAIKYLHDMERQGLQPDLQSYTLIINGYSKVADMKRAQKWFHRMKANGIQPDAYVYTSLIEGYMRGAEIEKAEMTFRHMTLKGITPTVVTYNVLMHHSIKQFDMATAVRFWGNILKAGLDPDVYTYAIMLHGLGDESRLDEAWQLFELMQKKNVDINHVVMTTMMGMHVKHHDNERTIKVFKEYFSTSSQDSKLKPTAYTQNVLLNALISNAELDVIQEYYNHYLQSLDAEPKDSASLLFSGANAFTYTTFMRAFLRRDALPMVMQVYQDMSKRHVKPTMVTYATLMLAHAFIPDPDSCVQILQELKLGGLEPNVVLYTIVMRAWAKAGRWERVKETYEEMKAANIQPNKLTMQVLRWGSDTSKQLPAR